jgi:hypothetical protein
VSKTILTIGLSLANSEAAYVDFQSKISLLDWDIILFKPQIGEFYRYADVFQGKPSLTDSASFQLKECSEHWRRELKQAFDAGKTIIVFLPALQQAYIDSGRRSYSGTGRNQKTTRHVDLYDNYRCLPMSLSPVPTNGSSIKLVDRGAEVLAHYWGEFGNVSSYQVLLTHEGVPASLKTRTGDQTVGALYRNKRSPGAIFLLPDIDFELQQPLVEAHDDKYEGWTTQAQQFASRMVSSIVQLDKALKSDREATPEPLWASTNNFTLESEVGLRSQLLDAELQIDTAQRLKDEIAVALQAAGALRGLLYEKGKPLEIAIIDALRILGFSAAQFKQSDSEFDVVFESSEGRLIGEAEGKDTKAVNVDKLRQLSMNIHEDLQREEIIAPAKPVLFGNGFRLKPLEERGDPFTEKCHSAAGAASTALVFTPDLFSPIQYLVRTANSEYAAKCRQTILSSTGRVVFPSPPTDCGEPNEIIVDDRGDNQE